jgi:ribosome-associated toxin RatA of RatAB toxin-antitoxin module
MIEYNGTITASLTQNYCKDISKIILSQTLNLKFEYIADIWTSDEIEQADCDINQRTLVP